MGSSSAIAVVSDGEGGFSVAELEIDDPGPHEVLVEITKGPASSPRSAKVSQGSRPAIASC
jgi:Zn-dependent alcohol dehydrogenase